MIAKALRFACVSLLVFRNAAFDTTEQVRDAEVQRVEMSGARVAVHVQVVLGAPSVGPANPLKWIGVRERAGVLVSWGCYFWTQIAKVHLVHITNWGLYYLSNFLHLGQFFFIISALFLISASKCQNIGYF